jgi:hypothetical protein
MPPISSTTIAVIGLTSARTGFTSSASIRKVPEHPRPAAGRARVLQVSLG